MFYILGLNGGRLRMIDKPILYIVVPCYNEQEVLLETSKRLYELLTHIIKRGFVSTSSKIVFIDDGSTDKTWSIIQSQHDADKIFSGVKLSRNRGHQNALLAGLMSVKKFADCVISIDADLQDDINVIPEFINKYKDGNDVVYGVRKSRKKDTFLKRITANLFYKLMIGIGVDLVYNHADYRLISKRVLEGLSEFKEVNIFLRGIIPLIGYKCDVVYYERHERFAGQAKYPLRKMLSLALDGITSFSTKPLRFVTWVGFITSIFSIGALLYALVSKLLGFIIQGWSSIVFFIFFIGGIQLLAIGLIGEYIGKIYKEVKSRPKYFIETFLNDEL